MEKREKLLKSLDKQLRALDAADPLIAGLDQYQQSAFDLLRSPKLREAVDPKKLDAEGRRALRQERARHDGAVRAPDGRGGRAVRVRPVARAGTCTATSPRAASSVLPLVDAMLSSLLEDLRRPRPAGTTIVTVLGEMGRNKIYKDPAYSGPPGRDHWGTTQFVIVAGGGFKQRHGPRQDRQDVAARRRTSTTRRSATAGRCTTCSGIDPDKELYTTTGQPVKIISTTPRSSRK